MKLHVLRDSLLAACQLAGAAIPSKEIKPILKNVKVTARRPDGDDPGGLTLIATDLEVGIRVTVQGMDVLEPGETTLPAKRLTDILREARDSELALEVDGVACLIRGTLSPLEFELVGDDAAAYPDFPAFTDEVYHEISAGSLREMIRRTVFATANETARFSMTGVAFELDGAVIRLIATDGRRLALSEGVAVAVGAYAAPKLPPIVPRKALSLLERHLAEDAETAVQIAFRPNEVLFRTERAVIYSRLLDGRFPDYRGVLPKKVASVATVTVAALHAAVRQAAIMTEADGRKVAFAFGPGQLTLRAQGATSGRSKVELPLESYSGDPMQTFINPDYLTDMLKVLPPDLAVEVRLLNPERPVVLVAGETYTHLVMPLSAEAK